jgi:choline dehydrogenase
MPDVVVVGGGTAGCVLAARLSEDPSRTVCLVEAGPDYGHYDEGRWPDDLLDGRALAFSHSWARDREDDRSQLRARVIGGCSSHNACALVRGEPADYDEWGPGWTHAELEPYLDRAERELGACWIPKDELSPWHRAFADAGDDVLRHRFNLSGTVRWNAAFAYLDPARGRANLEIRGDALVDRVLLEGGRASGVRTSAGDLHAGLVVLAAGAYGTPGILLRSGFGPPVGEGLSDHVGVGMGWEPTAAAVEEIARHELDHPLFMAGITVRSYSTMSDGLCDLFLFPALDPGPEISAAVFVMKPRSLGSVRLTSDDPEAPLAIDHGFLREPEDAIVLREGVEQLRALAATDPIDIYTGVELRPGAGADLDTYVHENARGFFHPTGTCGMGRVVDSKGRMLGVDGLVVADASIVPTIPRANTNLTVAAVAERIAASLG